jgi:hypothetical protein
MPELTHIGLDVHKEMIAVAVLRPDAGECEERTIANTPEALRRLFARFPDRGRCAPATRPGRPVTTLGACSRG